MSFKRIQIFAQNPLVLAYGFTQNRHFGAKIDQNSIILGRDPILCVTTKKYGVSVSFCPQTGDFR
jgi:hypothetical protein